GRRGLRTTTADARTSPADGPSPLTMPVAWQARWRSETCQTRGGPAEPRSAVRCCAGRAAPGLRRSSRRWRARDAPVLPAQAGRVRSLLRYGFEEEPLLQA